MARNRIRYTFAGMVICLLVVVGAMTAFAAPPAQDEEPPPADGAGPPNLNATYLGTQVCIACHSSQRQSWQMTAHAGFIQEPDEETVAGDFTDEAALTIEWPDGETRPITQDDIAYVIGGRYVQQYITRLTLEDGSAGYFVLPVQWNIPQEEDQVGVWTPYHPEDWTAPERNWQDACAGCHVTGLTEDEIAAGWDVADVELGIACEACHGPGSEHIMKPTENKMVLGDDVQVCGQCHIQGSDPSGQYGYPVGYQPGLPLDETVFLPAGPGDETVWWPNEYAKTYNTFSEWLGSGHSDALQSMLESEYAEDSCLQCHSTKPSTIAAEDWNTTHAEFGVTCTACHDVHPEPGEGEDAEDFTPAKALLADDNYTLCVQCHTCCEEDGTPLTVGGELHHPVQTLFEGRSIIAGVEGVPSAHFEIMGEDACLNCHMTESVSIGEYGRIGTHTMSVATLGEIGPGQPDACSGCHANVSPETLQQFVSNTQEGVSRRLQVAYTALEQNPDAPDWVARALEFVGSDGSLGIHNYAYTDKLLYAAESELGLAQPAVTINGTQADIDVKDPSYCATCHQEVHDLWLTSPHANAALNDNFVVEYAQRGQPVYCMDCHASGYDPEAGTSIHDGVICSSCHQPVGEGDHPPASMQASNASILCGQCHNGAHAPTYHEWLASPHSEVGVDCVDCHTPHNNGLILGSGTEGLLTQGSVNETCGSCHPEALIDDVHMGDNMSCEDCHIERRLADDGIHVVATGHTMSIAPETCSECHGGVHVVSTEDSAPEPELTVPEQNRVEELEGEVERLEDDAQTKWNSGVVGGAIGMLVVIFIGFVILRRGKVL